MAILFLHVGLPTRHCREPAALSGIADLSIERRSSQFSAVHNIKPECEKVLTRSQAVARIADRVRIAITAEQAIQFLAIVANAIASPAVNFEIYWALSRILGHEFDLSGSRDVIGHVTI